MDITPAPSSPDPPLAQGDPFGLWSVEYRAEAGESQWGQPFSGAPGTEPPSGEVLVWRITAPDDLGWRAGRVSEISAGLDSAQRRFDNLLAGRAGGEGEHLIETEPPPVMVPPQPLMGVPPEAPAALTPEARLMSILLASGAPPVELAPYSGIPIFDQLSRVDWAGMQARLSAMLAAANRQLLHYCWVETILEGILRARTTVNWGGDTATYWRANLSADQRDIHRRSLRLALESRGNTVRVVAAVTGMASRLALAFTTPLGPVQLLALAWDFLNQVLLESNGGTDGQ